MILQHMYYKHFKGGVYKVLMLPLNATDGKEMVAYVGKNDPRIWVCPAAEFEQKFMMYLPFGTVLHKDGCQFAVTHNGLGYVQLYCNETGEEYKLKLVDVKRHHVSSWAVVTMYDNKTKINYEFEVKL